MKSQKIKHALICLVSFICLFSGCTHNVTDKEIAISFNGSSLTGSYTGTIDDGLPNGSGHFVSNADNRNFDYNGQWKNGSITGNGKLTDTQYVVHFKDFDRTGEYTGDVLDGKAHGNGSFTAFNDENVKYTYTGSWKNGLWNGQGVQKYDSEDYYVKTGTFNDGEFSPTKLELIKSLGDWENMRFTPTEKAEEFIKQHEDLFPADDDIDITKYIDSSLTYKKLIKNPEKFGDKLVNFSNYEVTQISEREIWGYVCTEFLAASPNYDDYVYGFYLGELPNIYEGSKITIQGLPISSSSFENTGGGTTLCYIIYGCKIK